MKCVFQMLGEWYISSKSIEKLMRNYKIDISEEMKHIIVVLCYSERQRMMQEEFYSLYELYNTEQSTCD